MHSVRDNRDDNARVHRPARRMDRRVGELALQTRHSPEVGVRFDNEDNVVKRDQRVHPLHRPSHVAGEPCEEAPGVP